MKSTEQLQAEIISLLKDYSGRRTISPDQMIGRDVGLNGWDGIDIVEEIEEKYGVRLEAFIQAKASFLPPSWWDWLRGRKYGPPNSDCTVQELSHYVAEQIKLQGE